MGHEPRGRGIHSLLAQPGGGQGDHPGADRQPVETPGGRFRGDRDHELRHRRPGTDRPGGQPEARPEGAGRARPTPWRGRRRAVRIRQFYNRTVQILLPALAQVDAGSARTSRCRRSSPSSTWPAGTISGFDINYHDVKLLAIDWEEKPVDDAAVKALAKDDAGCAPACSTGASTAPAAGAGEPDRVRQPGDQGRSVEAHRRRGGRGNSMLLRVTNTGEPARPIRHDQARPQGPGRERAQGLGGVHRRGVAGRPAGREPRKAPSSRAAMRI